MKYLTIISLALGLVSCGGAQKSDHQSDTTTLNVRADTATPESNPAVLQERFERGIDFVATGNEPFWSLDINMNGNMHFKALDGPEISALTPEGVKALDADVILYTAESEQGSIVAQLIRQECMDTMSGARSEYTVRVEILAAANESPATYDGCGRYLADTSLNGNWTLESINNNPLNASDFMKGPPQLEFDLEAKRVAGHSGCNNISGDIEVQGHTINFKPMIATKMACPGMEFEYEYLKNFAGNVNYRVEAGILHLQVSSDSTYTYRKTN